MNADNDEPITKEGLTNSIEGWPIVHPRNLTAEQICDRCDEKNEIRLRYGRETKDVYFDEGERIRVTVVYDDDLGIWRITGAFHDRHSMLDPEDAASPDVAQARATGRVESEGWTYYFPPVAPDDKREYHHIEDRYILHDVEVEWFSPKGEGEEREPVGEVDEETGTVVLEPTDPRPYWPEETNQWRKDIMMRHGDWDDDIETVAFGI